MADKTYIVRFTHTDGTLEEVEHLTQQDAERHMNLFTDDDADIYTQIDLVEYDWKARRETICITRAFKAA